MKTSTIPQFLNSIPLMPLQILLILRIGIWVSAALAAIFIIWSFTLNGKLSVRAARKLLRNSPQTHLFETPKPKVQQEKPTTSKKAKRPLITFTLSQEAEQILEKISLQINVDNGWGGTVQNTKNTRKDLMSK